MTTWHCYFYGSIPIPHCLIAPLESLSLSIETRLLPWSGEEQLHGLTDVLQLLSSTPELVFFHALRHGNVGCAPAPCCVIVALIADCRRISSLESLDHLTSSVTGALSRLNFGPQALIGLLSGAGPNKARDADWWEQLQMAFAAPSKINGTRAHLMFPAANASEAADILVALVSGCEKRSAHHSGAASTACCGDVVPLCRGLESTPEAFVPCWLEHVQEWPLGPQPTIAALQHCGGSLMSLAEECRRRALGRSCADLEALLGMDRMAILTEFFLTPHSCSLEH